MEKLFKVIIINKKMYGSSFEMIKCWVLLWNTFLQGSGGGVQNVAFRTFVY